MTNMLRKHRIKPEKPVSDKHMLDIEAYIERSVPDKHKIATRRALLGQTPRSAAIRIKCLQCTNYQREEITNCAVNTCALLQVRPYQVKSTLIEPDLEGEQDDDEE